MKKLIVQIIFFSLILSSVIQLKSQDQQHLDSLKNVLHSSQNDSIKYHVALNLADKLKYNDVDSSISLSKYAIDISSKNDWTKELFNANYALAMIYRGQSSDDEARKILTRNLEIAIELTDSNMLGSTYGNIANTYIIYNQYDTAISLYMIALDIFEKTNNKGGISVLHATLGNLYLTMESYDKALHNYLIARKLFEELGNQAYFAITSMNIGIIYRNKNKLDSALVYYEFAKEKFAELEEHLLLAQSIGNIARIYALQENYSKSLDYFKQSSEFFSKFNAIRDLAIVYGDIGAVYDSINDYNNAINYYEKSAKLSMDEDLLDKTASSYESLALVYKKKKDYRASLHYFELFKDYSDSLITVENKKNTDKLLIEFETKEKEKEISLLKIDKTLDQERIKRKNILLIAISFGILFSLLFIIVINRNYKQKKQDNKLLEEQKEEIKTQRDQVVKHQKQLTDSITYAGLIQKAMMPENTTLQNIFSDHFIFFNPRDGIGGDFYWVKVVQDYTIIAAADCTGHGVPGAMLSMLGISILNELARQKEIKTSAQLLERLRDDIKTFLKQGIEDRSVKDGMDISVCVINNISHEMQFAGANNNVFLAQNNEFIELTGTKNPIGVYLSEMPFENQIYQLKKGDKIYLFSDGFIDQFGGEKGQKYYSNNFKKLLSENVEKPMPEQKSILTKTFENWKGEYDQIDDVLVFGIQI